MLACQTCLHVVFFWLTASAVQDEDDRRICDTEMCYSKTALPSAAGSAEAVLSSRSSEHVSTNPEFGAYVKALGDTRPVAGADRSDVHETQYDEANLDMFKFCIAYVKDPPDS